MNKVIDKIYIFMGFLIGNLIFQLIVSETVDIKRLVGVSFISIVIYSMLEYLVSRLRKN